MRVFSSTAVRSHGGLATKKKDYSGWLQQRDAFDSTEELDSVSAAPFAPPPPREER